MEYLGENKPVNLIQPLVSICVPTFQHESYIAQCLQSLLEQQATFPIEILIGEDASTDKTREICLGFAEKHPDKIRLFLRKEEEKAIMYGRKAGRYNHLGLYRSARGKYVCICDGDDYWTDPLKIQMQVDFMEQNPDCVLCLTDTEIGLHPEQKPPGIPEGLRIFESKELRKVFYMGHISSWMLRNCMEELLSNPIVKKPIPLDQVLFSFYKKKGKVAYLPKSTSFYRFNPDGIYLSQSRKKNHKAVYRNSWFLFRYIHHDPLLFFRAIVYGARRYFSNFVFNR